MVCLSAESPRQSTPQTQAQTPTFRVRTDLVTLDVAVTEENGRPVRGLTAKDFTVLEDGRPQSVSVFRAIDVPDEPWVTPWMGNVRQDVVTNDQPPGRLVAILIDDAISNGEPATIKAAIDAARAFIDYLGPSDRATVIFARDSRRAQPFTSDRERLRAAVDQLDAGFIGMGPSPLLGEQAMRVAELGDSLHRMGALRTIEDTVRALGTSEHFPRALFYIGVGVKIDWNANARPASVGPGRSPAVQDLHRAYVSRLKGILHDAARMNIVVHTADPGGLTPAPEDSPGDTDFLLILSRNTGGVSIINTNDLRPGMAAIAEATRSVYLLGYVPDVLKPGLRRTEVKVNRPGLTVRTRSYYERLTEADGAKVEARKPPAELAAISGLLPQPGIPLRIAAVPVPFGTGGQATVAIVLGVKHPSPGRARTETLSLVTTAYDMEGRFKAATKGKAQVVMADVESETAEYEVYSRIELPPGRYQLRLSVDNRARSQTGSVYTDVDVPDFTKRGLHLAGTFVDAGPSRLKAAPPDLLKEDVPILPTAQRDFVGGTRLVAFVRLVQGARDSLHPVTIASRVTDGAGKVIRSGSETIASSAFGRGRAADYRVGIPTSGLAPGWYLLSLEASLPGGPVQRKDVSFRVTASK
jgi:VWFA-related protein